MSHKERSIILRLSSTLARVKKKGVKYWLLNIFLQAIKQEDITARHSPLTRTDICERGS